MRTLGRVLLAGAALLALLAGSCSGGTSGPFVDLSATSERQRSADDSVSAAGNLVLAVAAVNSPRSTIGAYENLVGYLGRRLDLKVKLVGSKTYAEINSLVRSGDATLAMVCSAAYVYGHAEFGMEALVIPVVDGQTTYYSYLIVPNNSPIRSWQELRGRTFAFTDPMSNSGRLVALYKLWELGETPERFFDRYIFTYSHDSSIKSVAWGVVDAAVVDSLVFDYALAHGEDDADKTRKVWQSPPYGINPIAVHPNLDPEIKARLRQELLQMHESDEGRAILAELGFDRFVPARDEDYDSIRDMMRLVEVRQQ